MDVNICSDQNLGLVPVDTCTSALAKINFEFYSKVKIHTFFSKRYITEQEQDLGPVQQGDDIWFQVISRRR